MKYFIVLLLVIPSYLFSQENKNIIQYDTLYEIAWGDFIGQPDTQSPDAANSYTGIDLSMKQKNSALVIDVFSFFDRNLSWVREGASKEGLLRHEQFHFHITELYARKLRKELIEYRFTQKNLQTKLQPIFKDFLDQLSKEQKKYDKETNHHINTKEQIKWERSITDELSTYDSYKNSKVQLILR
jgi:hypothetical protein